MKSVESIDRVVVCWGERLFYPANRIVKADPAPRLTATLHDRASAIRKHVKAALRQAPQAVLRVAGGGRGMRAIRAHFMYISRNGQLEIEDDRGVQHAGKEAVRSVLDQWRFAGTQIPQASDRREAFNLVLSTPSGTDPGLLLTAARDFARAEMLGHHYVLVLHEDRDHPHVHLTVRAESATGKRLQTWTERERWRVVFAERLRALGVDVEATRQSCRGELRNFETMGRLQLESRGDLRFPKKAYKTGEGHAKYGAQALQAWAHMRDALAESPIAEDREIAEGITGFVRSCPYFKQVASRTELRARLSSRDAVEQVRADIEITR